jgi:hypothetical protein
MRNRKGNALEIFLITFFILIFIFFTVFFFIRFGNRFKPDTPTGPNDTKPGSSEVKIDLLGSDSASSIVGKVIPFVLPDGTTEIICEPGASYHTKPFFVKNTGDVKVDYIVSLSEGSSIEAKAFKEAFDFWITTDPDSTEAAVPLVEYRGVLDAKSTSPAFYLVIAMNEKVGNKYQGRTFETVGITITATEHDRSGQE